MFKVDLDDEARLVRCVCDGFFSVAELRDHATRLREAVAQSRRKFGRARVLVLSPNAVVQTPEVVEATQREAWRATEPGDRMAIVLTSSLTKLQAARTFSSAQERMFSSEAEAVVWLKDDQGARAGIRADVNPGRNHGG